MVVLLASFAFSQTGTSSRVQTGYAIITPESGNSAGLILTETLIHTTANGIVETTLSPSSVLTNMAMTVNLGTLAQGTTGVAIVNPNAVAAKVQFAITDASGAQILAQTFTVLPHGQLSRFLNELFAGQLTAGMQSTGLLDIAADVPVAAVGLSFRDAGFTAQPLASLTSATPLTSFTSSIDPLAPAVAQPIVGVLAVAPASTSVGGSGSFIFPQVVNGGGWTTNISIANTSTAAQTVRIDFFDPVGIALQTVSGITIPSRGLYNLVQ
jgi:hypothetical protein